MTKYDFLIVGSGLYGCVFAREAMDAGKRVLVLERRGHTGGNVHCNEIEGINVHAYGAHIFHTRMKYVWEYVNRFAVFNRFTNCPLANFKGQIFNLPFNMNTFHQMWGVRTPYEARRIIEDQRSAVRGKPKNLEEQAITLVGTDIYERLVKGYTEKQWGRPCTELPPFIIKRLPVRFTYNNNYFNDRYQGVPVGGYNVLIERLLEGADVILNEDYNRNREKWNAMADKIVYTGTLDSFYDYRLGRLEYRSLRFETQVLPHIDNFQGVAVMNYTDRETPFTRIVEHKHFEFGTQPSTVITREYPLSWEDGMEPYYPVNDDRNSTIYAQYAALAIKEPNVIFGGRLAEYNYFDMDKVVESALNAARECFGRDRHQLY